jgi:hypothetical protein
MSVDDWDSWPWHQQQEAACVTVIRGLSTDDIVRVWHDRPLTELADQNAAADWEEYDGTVGDARGYLALGELEPGVVFVWEFGGGFEASRPEVITDLSAQGSACCNYWNDVNCTPTFHYAVNGRELRRFTTDDPAMPYGDGTDEPLPEERELPWPLPFSERGPDLDPGADGRVSALQLQATLMRVPVADPSWLERDGVRWFGAPFWRNADPRPDES